MNAPAVNRWLDLVQASAPAPVKPLRIDRVRQLETARDALRAGLPVPREAAEWLAEGFDAYLQEGGDLEAHLGIQPRRGGARETIHAIHQARQRDDRLVLGIVRTPGDSISAKVRRLHQYLSEGGEAPFQGAEDLRRLFEQGGARLPGVRRLTSIFMLSPDQVVHLRV